MTLLAPFLNPLFISLLTTPKSPKLYAAHVTLLIFYMMLTPFYVGVHTGTCPYTVVQCVTDHFDHSANDSPSHSMNNTSIQSSTKHRDLGIILSSNLSWSNHYNDISCSTYCYLHLIPCSFASILPVYLKKVFTYHLFSLT